MASWTISHDESGNHVVMMGFDLHDTHLKTDKSYFITITDDEGNVTKQSFRITRNGYARKKDTAKMTAAAERIVTAATASARVKITTKRLIDITERHVCPKCEAFIKEKKAKMQHDHLLRLKEYTPENVWEEGGKPVVLIEKEHCQTCG